MGLLSRMRSSVTRRGTSNSTTSSKKKSKKSTTANSTNVLEDDNCANGENVDSSNKKTDRPIQRSLTDSTVEQRRQNKHRYSMPQAQLQIPTQTQNQNQSQNQSQKNHKHKHIRHKNQQHVSFAGNDDTDTTNNNNNNNNNSPSPYSPNTRKKIPSRRQSMPDLSELSPHPKNTTTIDFSQRRKSRVLFGLDDEDLRALMAELVPSQQQTTTAAKPVGNDAGKLVLPAQIEQQQQQKSLQEPQAKLWERMLQEQQQQQQLKQQQPPQPTAKLQPPKSEPPLTMADLDAMLDEIEENISVLLISINGLNYNSAGNTNNNNSLFNSNHGNGSNLSKFNSNNSTISNTSSLSAFNSTTSQLGANFSFLGNVSFGARWDVFCVMWVDVAGVKRNEVRWPVKPCEGSVVWNSARELCVPQCSDKYPNAPEGPRCVMVELWRSEFNENKLLACAALALDDLSLDSLVTVHLIPQVPEIRHCSPTLTLKLISPPPEEKTLFIIRHAESKWNHAQANRDIVAMLSSTDHPLNQNGVQQAVDLQQKIFVEKHFVEKGLREDELVEEFFQSQVVLCSPLTRAVQTALITTLPVFQHHQHVRESALAKRLANRTNKSSTSSKSNSNTNTNTSNSNKRSRVVPDGGSANNDRAVDSEDDGATTDTNSTTTTTSTTSSTESLGKLYLMPNAREKRNLGGQDSQGRVFGPNIRQRALEELAKSGYHPELFKGIDLDFSEVQSRWWNNLQEGKTDVRQRLHEFMNQVKCMPQDKLILVGHSHFFRELFRAFLHPLYVREHPDMAQMLQKWVVQNCGVMCLRLDFFHERMIVDVDFLFGSSLVVKKEKPMFGLKDVDKKLKGFIQSGQQWVKEGSREVWSDLTTTLTSTTSSKRLGSQDTNNPLPPTRSSTTALKFVDVDVECDADESILMEVEVLAADPSNAVNTTPSTSTVSRDDDFSDSALSDLHSSRSFSGSSVSRKL